MLDRVAENAGVVNILATPTTTVGSVSMSRNLILIHLEKLKLLNSEYNVQVEESKRDVIPKKVDVYALANNYRSPVIARRRRFSYYTKHRA